jgi:N-sulfoglucosamine sulfohydrolase
MNTAALFQRWVLIAALAGYCLSAPAQESVTQRATDAGPVSRTGARAPNILWITAEDMSATLGCYGDAYATTPHIDRLARQSVRYTHAFASAPVCSPARSTLITGCEATSLGTQQMRSAFPLPAFMRGFPALLRERGYYTSNNVKTDYNTGSEPAIIAASWNESSPAAHWNKRRKNQAFFSVFNLMVSHQSRTMVWPHEQFVREVQSRLSPGEIHDPTRAPVPPYYPDTPIIREAVARYYDCVSVMDKEVGAILRQLEEDGLAEETIVFFFSDHGSGMPRHKRALLDSGMHVPLLVRFPEKYRHLAPAPAGETINRLVSFADFGPTVLSLANVDVPETMQGRPFLGAQDGPPREWVFGHRDRVDEALDLARSARNHRYLYIRNYMPHLGYHQPTAWPDLGQIRHEIYRLAHRDQMTGPQWHYAGPTRPAEELYDCETDPLNLINLADSPSHQTILEGMRQAHLRQIRESRDVGFIPESEAWKIFGESTPWEAARSGAFDLDPWFNAAAQVGLADEAAFQKNLGHADSGVRYWGAMGLVGRTKVSPEALRKLESVLDDGSMAVRIEAANALARNGQIQTALPVLVNTLRHSDLNVVLHATRTVELLGPIARAATPVVREVVGRIERIRPPQDVPPTVVQSPEQDLAMFISFSANAFLSRTAPGSNEE